MIANPDNYLFWGTNPDWYDYDENEHPYLTDKAPEEAKESFKKYLELIERQEKSQVRFI
jgi:hypothetical protein